MARDPREVPCAELFERMWWSCNPFKVSGRVRVLNIGLACRGGLAGVAVPMPLARVFLTLRDVHPPR